VVFADKTAAETSFEMPEKNVSVKANYAQLAVEEKPELSIRDVEIPAEEEGYSQAASRSVEITNIGTGKATLTALYPSGGNASAFVVNEDGRTRIAAGATDTSWNVTPVTGLTAGVYTAQFVAEYDGLKAYADISFTVKAKPVAEYQLTVENGSGSGTYQAGAAVNLSANPPADGMLFDKWTATAGSLSHSSSSETTFTMPAENATVTAVYKAKERLAVPVVTWSDDGTSVSWTEVQGATAYQYYRIKADGTETGRDKTTETSYTFSAVGVPGDVFLVRAIDANGNYVNSDYGYAKFELAAEN